MTRTLGTDLRGHRMRQNESINARQEGVQKTHLREVEMTEAVQPVKRKPWEHQGASRTLGSSRGSWGTHPNVSENAQNEKVKKTHQRELKASQRARAAKHLYQVVSTMSRKVLGMLEPSVLTEQMHQVVIQTKDGTWRCRRSRRALKSIGTAKVLSRALDMVGNVPRPRRTSATSKQMCSAEIEGQEAIEARKLSWEMLRVSLEKSAVNRSTKAMAMASYTKGIGSGWMAQ